jgi:hypothetical protein
LINDEHLTSQYHDQPERHRYGHAFYEPGTPSTITPNTTQAASTGIDDGPARGDHVHGLTGIAVASIASDDNYQTTGTDVVGNGAVQTGLTSATLSVVNSATVTRTGLILIQCRPDLQNVGVVVRQGYVNLQIATTQDGSTPSSFADIGPPFALGQVNYPVTSYHYNNLYSHHYIAVGAGLTLKVIVRIRFYGDSADMILAYQALRTTVLIL